MERRVKVKRYKLEQSSDTKVKANVSKIVGFFNVTIKTKGKTKLAKAVSESSPEGFLDVLVEELGCCHMGNYTPEEANQRGWCTVCRSRRSK